MPAPAAPAPALGPAQPAPPVPAPNPVPAGPAAEVPPPGSGTPTAAAPPGPGPAVTPPTPRALPNLLPDLGFDALAEAQRKFWAKVFDPKSYQLPPGLGDLSHPPGTVVIETRACSDSSGVPDCVVAAKAVCGKRGFADGRPFDSQSTRTCPKDVAFGLRQAEPGECKTNYTIISSMCW